MPQREGTLPGKHSYACSTDIMRQLKIPSLAALSVPSVHAPVQGLDSILVNFNPTFTKSREILPNAATSQDDLRKLQAEARVIKAKFDVWASSQTGEWVPRMMHKYDLPPSYPHFSSCHGDWTRYFDRAYSLTLLIDPQSPHLANDH